MATIFTVSDFIAHVNDVLSRSWNAEDLAVEGEVTGFRISQGQWVNFDLKDAQGLVNVFMTVWQLYIPLEDGMRVQVFGQPKVYPKFGKFSLTATRVEPVGEGALKKALAALKARLESEGLFDPSRKRELPIFPERIALVASRESAAYGDFIRIIGERWRGLQIDLYHVKVQGEGAPQDIVNAIKQANAMSLRPRQSGGSNLGNAASPEAPRNDNYYDALVLTRGGGSLEELMAFNDEQVTRAIHGSKIPTLVGIGHERDLSLAELAADVRGSTPTDCARRLVPDRKDVLRDLAYKSENLERLFLDQVQQKRDLLERSLLAPRSWIERQKQEVGRLTLTADANVRQWLRALTDRYRSHHRLLASLDPKGVLARGYAMLRDARGRTVVGIAALSPGQTVTAVLRDGEGDLRVESLRSAKTGKQQSLL